MAPVTRACHGVTTGRARRPGHRSRRLGSALVLLGLLALRVDGVESTTRPAAERAPGHPAILQEPCGSAEGEALLTSARRGLERTLETANEAGWRFTIHGFARSLDRGGNRVLGEETGGVTGVGFPLVRWVPSVGSVPVADFLTTPISQLCPRIEGEADGAVAVSFDWTGEGRSVAWVDQTDERLLGLDVPGPDSTVSATVAFRAVSDQFTIVERWSRRVSRDDGWVETGGIVNAIEDDQGTVYRSDALAVLSGSVFDSTTIRPLVGAVVSVVGTEWWVPTDDRGEFLFIEHFDGDYEIVFGHPYLDSLGFLAAPVTVSLTPGGQTDIQLVTPSLSEVVAQRCDQETLRNDRRALQGVVRDGNGDPVPNARIVVVWQTMPRALQRFAIDDRSAQVRTDSLGTYAICAIPLGQDIVVRAEGYGRFSRFLRVNFAEFDVSVGDRVQELIANKVARLDISLLEDDEMGRLAGIITDNISGLPLVGAEVTALGLEGQVSTGLDGRFVYEDLPPGSHTLNVRKIGYRRVRYDIEILPGQTTQLEDGLLTMPPGAVELTPLVVEADGTILSQRQLAGFFDRRTVGVGRFVTREEFERWNPTVATDILRRVGGITVLPNPGYLVRGDNRRYLLRSRRSAGLSAGCSVNFFIDGVYSGTSNDPDTQLDMLVPVATIEAIEVYNGVSQIPAQFSRTGTACGVIVVWTR